ncbi:glutamine amidotransferase [Tahibacter amnicola]|uniref:Glutamine amidotransferase n=1 Tax=Tahibacter amnicola TaxID=2976241 RepID=A0ABY6BG80_9GAMM|nr:glutamine amidotransferase [Tahibacter amnicola]UXI68611.1 glutamine amidotransferase [Tahibacter amnicola]
MRPFLIVQTGTTLPALRARRRDFPHWFRIGMGLPVGTVHIHDATADAAFPALDRYAGVIVTGSGAMVTERQAWSERTAEWLATVARAASCPVLGVCYGHQLLAHGLGGEVGWAPKGREIGTRDIVCTSATRSDPLFAPLARGFRAQTTHQQSVLTPPAGALVLAASDHDAHQAVRYGERAWGVQFHPEFSAGVMAGYVRGRAERLREEGIDPGVLLQTCGPTPAGRRLLRRFVRLAERS